MKHFFIALMGLVFAATVPARGDHQDLSLLVAPELVSSGLMAFLLPRFSLKTGVKVHAEPLDAGRASGNTMQLQPGTGTPALTRQDQTYGLTPPDMDDKPAVRFFDWVMSDIGQRTINQFAPNGAQMFFGAADNVVATRATAQVGDVSRGAALSYVHCGRCHVVGARNRMSGIGSTPSFGLLRGLDDWEDRFRAFYALNPHPSFTQIAGITAPFDKTRPSPIWPLALTSAELDDIVAFTAGITPLDLGAPLVHQ
ncbi:MAG: hypothetical protein L3J36_01450 [Rhodobacteraceae bacterium]|nr:hypothetical protein [Paracoccaceae bacterium]